MIDARPNVTEAASAFEALDRLCDGFLPAAEVRAGTEPVPSEGMPPVYRRLLVHHEHMTQVLRDYFQSLVALKVLRQAEHGDAYSRMIVLTLPHGGRIVEFGIARLDLRWTAPEVRQEIVARQMPLGDILIRHKVLRRIEPLWFLKFDAAGRIAGFFDRALAGPTYGRIGVIHCNGAPAIELLEVVAADKETVE